VVPSYHALSLRIYGGTAVKYSPIFGLNIDQLSHKCFEVNEICTELKQGSQISVVSLRI